ncbi:MAG: murein transglycosylase [Flavobacteriaceae bacterium]|nr:MAG: murein transglycosylase [Flavobacteriaceae bacterium]
MQSKILPIFFMIIWVSSCRKEPISIQNPTPLSVDSVVFPDSLSFAGEPFDLNREDIKMALRQDLVKNSFYHSNMVLLIQKSSRVFPIIENILKQENVPNDFKYLAAIESNLDPKISSPVGAKGYWQFLPDTAKEYGLIVNEEIDQRSDLEASTKAACKFLKYLKQQTGSWTLAAAAYNTGLGNIQKVLLEQKADTNTSYFDLKLNEETGRYLYRIGAIKQILSHPEMYGFSAEKLEKRHKLKHKWVTSPLHWVDFAREYKISFAQLCYYNPWIVSPEYTAKENTRLKVYLPKD